MATSETRGEGQGGNEDGTKLLFTMPGQHIYDGTIFPEHFPATSLDAIKQMEFDPTDILVVAYPKSGYIWTKELVWLICNKADVTAAKKVSIFVRSPLLDASSEGHSGFEMAKLVPPPRIMSIHQKYYMVQKALERTKPRVVMILRNPKDVLVSWYHFYRMDLGLGPFKGTWDEFFELFRAEQLAFGDPLDFIREWWNANRDKNYVLFIKYEDLIRDLHQGVRQMATFLKQDLTTDQIDVIAEFTSFPTMKARMDPQMEQSKGFDTSISPFFRKGIVGDWKSYFTPAQLEYYDKVYHDKMARHRTTL